MDRGAYRLNVIGPLQLFDRQGKEITPTGAMIQGLLGLLVSTEGCPWNRSALQDKLWSTRGQIQGRDSLKKALSSVRKLFGADVDAEVYDIEGQSISRVFYFPINDDEWNGESAQLLNLKALMSRIVNPSVTVMNHGYFDSTLQKSQDDVAKVFENTPYSIVTNLLGERLLEELDLMKDVDLGASRHRYEMEE